MRVKWTQPHNLAAKPQELALICCHLILNWTYCFLLTYTSLLSCPSSYCLVLSYNWSSISSFENSLTINRDWSYSRLCSISRTSYRSHHSRRTPLQPSCIDYVKLHLTANINSNRILESLKSQSRLYFASVSKIKRSCTALNIFRKHLFSFTSEAKVLEIHLNPVRTRKHLSCHHC